MTATSTDQLARLATFEGAVEAISIAYDFRAHPYFAWARSETTTRDEFRASQVPFRFAVEAWAQPLGAVLARTPRGASRRGVLRNLVDEHGAGAHGAGERGAGASASHEASFERYLRALGAGDEELGAPCPIAVRAFSEATTAFCLVQPCHAGAAALGAVEHLYVGVSAEIARLVVDRGWAPPGSQDHYAVHEELDVHHARDLLELARPAWESARSREEVALGLHLGAHLFWQLYRDLLPAR